MERARNNEPDRQLHGDQTKINIKMHDREPKIYFGDVIQQTNNGELSYGAINNTPALAENLATKSIPAGSPRNGPGPRPQAPQYPSAGSENGRKTTENNRADGLPD